MAECTQAPPPTTTAFDTMWKEWQSMAREWQTQSLDAWGSVTRNVVAADSFFNLMSASMDVYLATLKKMREGWQMTMQFVDIPRMEDLARVSQQVLTAETRVVEVEEQLDRALQDVSVLQRQLTEARKEAKAVREQMASVEERLIGLEAQRHQDDASFTPASLNGDEARSSSTPGGKRRK